MLGLAIGDVAHPTWRARSVGVSRLWRDGGKPFAEEAQSRLVRPAPVSA